MYNIWPDGDGIKPIKPATTLDVVKEMERAKDLVVKQIWTFVDRVEVKDERVVVHLNRPMEFVFHDDLCFTVRGEVGILGADRISIDGKEIHLNSRNCKQLRDFKEAIIKEILLQIKPIGELEHGQPIEIPFVELKNRLKKEIMDELLEHVRHYLGRDK